MVNHLLDDVPYFSNRFKLEIANVVVLNLAHQSTYRINHRINHGDN